MADYDAVVRHNMEELLVRFQRALELDLITAGDFERMEKRKRLGQPALRVESVGRP